MLLSERFHLNSRGFCCADLKGLNQNFLQALYLYLYVPYTSPIVSFFVCVFICNCVSKEPGLNTL